MANSRFLGEVYRVETAVGQGYVQIVGRAHIGGGYAEVFRILDKRSVGVEGLAPDGLENLPGLEHYLSFRSIMRSDPRVIFVGKYAFDPQETPAFQAISEDHQRRTVVHHGCDVIDAGSVRSDLSPEYVAARQIATWPADEVVIALERLLWGREDSLRRWRGEANAQTPRTAREVRFFVEFDDPTRAQAAALASKEFGFLAKLSEEVVDEDDGPVPSGVIEVVLSTEIPTAAGLWEAEQRAEELAKGYSGTVTGNEVET